MAQLFQNRQRLLATLSRTTKYYENQPSLIIPSRIRNYAHSATSRPQPSPGFSITFADGSLETIIAKSESSASEAVQEEEASEKESTTPKLKTNKKSSRRAIVHTQENRTLETPSSLITREIVNLEHSAETPGQQNLLIEYPDTRTIEDAGRYTVSQEGGETKIEARSGMRPKEQRPLTSYKEPWQVQKAALANKFGGEGWNPRKKLSPDTMEGIRALNAQYPEQYTTQTLAEHFAVSPEAIRRILKSKWSSNLDSEKAAERRERWAKRHDRLWDIKSEIGLRPKRKSVKKTEDPERFEDDLRAQQTLAVYRNG